MPFTRVFSGALSGVDAQLIEVEVNLDTRSFPAFNIVGLPAKEVDESKERVRSAIKNSGIKFPDGRITVNLAPADLPKKGALYDLPIALAILKSCGLLVLDMDDLLIFGELSLDGKVNKVKGTASLVELAGVYNKKCILPLDNLSELRTQNVANLFTVDTLKTLITQLQFNKLRKADPKYEAPKIVNDYMQLSSIKGQSIGKRALQIAAAGGHNIALFGPPGTGKTMLAKSLPSLLAPLSEGELHEVIKIYSSQDANVPQELFHGRRPFRSPHHSISRAGLIGGGTPVKPGEITLAHNGVLFLDEFTEFPKEQINALRQPLESKDIFISRASGHFRFPANFTLVVAYNLCPCGFYGHPYKECKCSPNQIQNYFAKLSGPIMERIDLHVPCNPVAMSVKTADQTYLTIEQINKMVNQISRAISIQQKRYDSDVRNSNAIIQKFRESFNLTPEARKHLLLMDRKKMIQSSRSFAKIMRVSRTIADLEDSDIITFTHIQEALRFREMLSG